MKRSETFQVEFECIPLINLRSEFNTYYTLLQTAEFQSQFIGKIKPIETPYMTWFGFPDSLLTLILQERILGIESYLPGAVLAEMGVSGILNHENVKSVQNPWILGGKSITENYYHRLPALYKEDASLKVSNNGLWDKNAKFYSEIRNRIFHGHELSRVDFEKYLILFEHLALLYDWIDSWHSPDNIVKGASSLSRTRSSKLA